MADTDFFTALELLGLTAIGESEDLGEVGMIQTINTIMNRVAANIDWMGGNSVRTVCLKKGQYDCWDAGTGDRERIIDIGRNNPLYKPYTIALTAASQAINGTLQDTTNGAVSYVDDDARACVHPGSSPCLIVGNRKFYDLKAVA